MIDYNKPTAMMLGRWQPWHQGHQMLFEQTLEKTGQVIIMVRDTPRDDSNPFDFETVKKKIEQALVNYQNKFDIIKVPNITNICYGRGVGYKIEEIVLPEEIQNISATKIRLSIKKINHWATSTKKS
jgi:phosphopantetheine adenylyltransferase